MRIRYSFCLLVCLFCQGSASARADSAAPAPDSCRYLFQIQRRAVLVTADHLSNIYLIAEDQQIEKYDSTGRRVAHYSNNRLGNADAMDVSNPLKIVVWYADFQTIIMLDRTLNEIGRLNLIDIGLNTVRCVAMAQDGNIWLYDDAGFLLRKITAAGEVILEGQPLNLVFSKRFMPTCIRDNGETVCVSDPEQGIAAFDQYGYLLRTYPDCTTNRFELYQNWLVFLGKGFLQLEQLNRFQSLKIPLPASAHGAGDLVWASGGLIFIQNGEAVEVYQTGF